jgi:hypothetical protein
MTSPAIVALSTPHRPTVVKVGVRGAIGPAGGIGHVDRLREDLGSTAFASNQRGIYIWQYSAASLAKPAFYRRRLEAGAPDHELAGQDADGNWWEIDEQEIDVRCAGCMVDGVTDDAAALNRAYKAGARLGVIVFIPKGQLLVKASGVLWNGLRVKGAGMSATTILVQPELTITPFPVPPNQKIDYVHLSDFTVDGQGTLNGVRTGGVAHLISGYACTGWKLERIKLTNAIGYCMGWQGYPFAVPGKNGPEEDLLAIDCIFDLGGMVKSAQTTLVNAIDADDTSITVGDYTILDATGGAIQVGDEFMKHGTVTGPTIGVTRGGAGSTPAAHAAGAPLYRLAGGDCIDIKHATNFTFIHCLFTRSLDKGLNPRVRFGKAYGCGARYCVVGFGLSSLGEEEDIFTTLTGAITSTTTTFPVVSTTGFPTAGTGLLDSETFTWTGTTATTLTGVTRGVNNSAAVAHASGTGVGWIQPTSGEADCYFGMFGCWAEHCDTGVAVGAGGIASTMMAEIHHFMADQCISGINLSGGATGAGRPSGRLRAKVIGGSVTRCTGSALYAQNLDSLIIDGFGNLNCDYGIEVHDNPNGGVIDNWSLTGNIHGDIAETGLGGRLRLGDGNGTNISLLAGSTRAMRLVPELGIRTEQGLSLGVTWTPGATPGTLLNNEYYETFVTDSRVGLADCALLAANFNTGQANVRWGANVTKSGSGNVRLWIENKSGGTLTPGTLSSKVFFFKVLST